MSERATPKTDAQPIHFVRGAGLDGIERMEPYVPAYFARKLERENEALKERVARLEEFAADLRARAQMAEQKLFNPNAPVGW